jgi:hypothetical protein
LVVDVANSKVSKYINGVKVGEQAVDSRWALCSSASTTPYALLFADNDGENGLTYVNSIQYWSGCLTDGNMATLGKPSAGGLPTSITGKIQLSVTRKGDAVVLDWTGGAAPFRLQKKNTLDRPWENASDNLVERRLTNNMDGSSCFYQVIGSN